MKVVAVERIRQIEAAADAAGISYALMMQRAGTAVAQRVLEIAAALPEQPRVTVLIGAGNNGGDGLVAARIIAEQSDAQVRCYLLKPRADDDAEYVAARDAGLFIANAEDDQRYRVLLNMVASAHIVVDALFGIGISLPLRDDAAKVLRAVQQALDAAAFDDSEGRLITPTSAEPSTAPTRPYIIAVDCPSGLDCDTGEIDRNALAANETVTFIAAKPGLLTFPGAQSVGTLHIADLAISEDISSMAGDKHTVADADTIRQRLPPRADSGHKGTFGKALIIGGSINYTGAAGLAAEAAYRIGAGLVTVGAPMPVIAALAAQLLEVTWMMLPHDMGVIADSAADIIRDEIDKYQALLIGPGFGREKTTGEMLVRLLHNSEARKKNSRRSIGFASTANDAVAPAESDRIQLPPLVIDADALYLLHQVESWWTLLPEQTVITPHPGEMATLVGLETKDVQANRWELAASKAAEWKVVLVLKGAHTLIADPGGAITVLPFKTAALATAGTGDVLAGMIAGLLAQGLSAFDAAVVGGYLHGLAGQMLAEQSGTRSVLAGDILRRGLPQALMSVELA